MFELLDQDPTLSMVHLRAYSTPEDGRICLAPGLWRSRAAADLASRLTIDANPEMQLRKRTAANTHGDRHVGHRGRHSPQANDQIVLRDIGRPWMMINALRRNKGRHFTTWTQESR